MNNTLKKQGDGQIEVTTASVLNSLHPRHFASLFLDTYVFCFST